MTVSIARVACMLTLCTLALSQGALAQRTVHVTHLGGNVATFATTTDDDLVPVNIVSGAGNALRGIAITPDGRTAYIVDSELATVSAFAVADGGLLTSLGPPVETDPNTPIPSTATCQPGVTIPTPCPFGVAVTPNGRWVYITNSETHTVSLFRVQHDGNVKLMGAPVPTGGMGPRGLAVSPNGERLYVAHRNTDSISVFAIHPNGELTLLGQPLQLQGCTPAPGDPATPECSPFWISITPDGRWLYVTNFVSGDIVTFAIDADGRLSQVARLLVGTRPESVAITADTRFLYVGLIDENVVKAFLIDADGTLTFHGSFPVCDEWEIPAACGAVSLAMAPDSNTLYVATTFKPVNDVLSFSIGTDGRLTQIGSVPTGGERPLFQAMSMRPNQGPVAAVKRATGFVAIPIQFDASDSVDPDGEVVRYDWDFGDGQKASDGGAKPRHTYAERGQYRVTVTVTDNESCSDTMVFTGQTAMCNGSRQASSSQVISVRHR
jgi:6-phosphogluconolactonase (cycloisomerase 2 family)